MKKYAFLILAIAAMGWQANAQDISKNAIGLRIGDSDGFGPEVNYQRALGDNNRLELGLAWHSKSHWNALKLTGIYQWVWNIDGGFNWYAGPGVGAGFVSYDRYYDYDHDYPYPVNRKSNSDAYGFLTGDVGIEYNFKFPLLISLDLRPQFNLGYHDDVTFDVGLGARYQF